MGMSQCLEKTQRIFRADWYAQNLDGETQEVLNAFMDYFNKERTNQGKYCQGRTPIQTLKGGLEFYAQYVFDDNVEELTAAWDPDKRLAGSRPTVNAIVVQSIL